MTDYFALIVVGMFTGFGNAVGSYLANKHAAQNLDKLGDKVSNLTDEIKKVIKE